MKMTTIIAAIMASFALIAADDRTMVQKFVAKDYAAINAVTNQYSITGVCKAAKYTNEDIVALAEAYDAASNYAKAAYTYAMLLKDADKAIVSAKKHAAAGFVGQDGRYDVPMMGVLNKDPEYKKLLAQHGAKIANGPASEAAKQPHLFALLNIVVWYNRTAEEPIAFTVKDESIIANTEEFNLSKDVLILDNNKEESDRLCRLMLNKAKIGSILQFKKYVCNASKAFKTKWYYEQAWNKTDDCNARVTFAIALEDPDRLLIALDNLKPDSLAAFEVKNVITLLNAQKVDWRADDVKKALLNINSMYTTKLYDDRDAWEPVLSKLRAMIEIR